MNYWEITVNGIGKSYTSHFVYYKTNLNLSPENVPKYAVKDGDLLDVFIYDVKKCREITKEEYFQHMEF